MTFAIVTDTASDTLTSTKNRNDVFVVSTFVMVNDREYLDKDLPLTELLELFDQGYYSTTSQPSPQLYLDTYNQALQQFDQVLSIHVGSRLSGLFQGAVAVAQDFDQEILHFDTSNVSFGSGYYVYAATVLKDKGLELEQVIGILQQLKNRVHLRVLIEDIDYLKRGGRVNVSMYWLLRLLRLRPIVGEKDGLIVRMGVVIGRQRGIDKIVNQLMPLYDDNMISFAGHINTLDDLHVLVELTKTKLCDPQVVTISSTLLSHTGPKALGVLIGPDPNKIDT